MWRYYGYNAGVCLVGPRKTTETQDGTSQNLNPAPPEKKSEIWD